MAILAASALAPAGAASAQVAYGPVVDFVPPTPSAGTPLTGMQHLRAQATAAVIRGLHLIIRSDDPSIPAFQSQADQGPGIGRDVVEANWDTSQLTHNGVYRLEALAETCGPAGCQVISSTRPGLLVANPPATPSAVHAAFQNNVPVVSWKSGGEADLLGYEVLRSSPSGPMPVGSVRAGDPTVFTDTTATSYLTAWPDLNTRPNASDLNWTPGRTVPNLVIVKLGSNGKLDIYNAAGSIQVIVDVVGWYR